VAAARTSWAAKINGRRRPDAGGAPHLPRTSTRDTKNTTTIITTTITIARSTGTTCLRTRRTAGVVVQATTSRQTT